MANALSPSSAICINSGTLDAVPVLASDRFAHYDQPNAGMNLGFGNLLQSKGTATLHRYAQRDGQQLAQSRHPDDLYLGFRTFTTVDVNGGPPHPGSQATLDVT